MKLRFRGKTSSEERQSATYEATVYDAIRPGYYDHVFERGRGVQWFWHYHRYAAVAADLPQNSHSILDLGCGPGTFLGRYTEGFDRAVGVDLAQAQIDYAKEKYRSERLYFTAADAIEFTRKEKFDVIVSIEVIEHLPAIRTQAFLKRIYELLKPGGTVILATPNYVSLWPVIEWCVSKVGHVDYLQQHINHFTVPRLEQELTRAGFIIQNRRTIFLISPFLACCSSRIAKLVYHLEQRFFPWRGSEIVLSARRPV